MLTPLMWFMATQVLTANHFIGRKVRDHFLDRRTPRERSSQIMRSFSVTVYHQGLVRHAAVVTRSRRALARLGGCAAARTLTSAVHKPCARNSRTTASVSRETHRRLLRID